MPLVVDGVQGPAIWAGNGSHPLCASDGWGSQAEYIHIGLVNNMPDSAMEATELQFFEMLDAASGGLPVRLTLLSLPNVPRSDRGQQRVDGFYFGINNLWKTRFDALIITGTEPHQSDLRQEAYWPVLGEVLDWAEDNTVSIVLSCLAAHAGVLHSDGIDRHCLREKQFGIFDFGKTGRHALTDGVGRAIRFPHSRWNEIHAGALASCGYSVLTYSATGGVDMFVKRKRKSLFVHFQGHPEYGTLTLLKEYRRDTRRFLKRERETYPSIPRGYFDAEATELLSVFREQALANPSEELFGVFPEEAAARNLTNTWHSSAIRVYHNWLQYVASRKTGSLSVAAMSCIGQAGSVAVGGGKS